VCAVIQKYSGKGYANRRVIVRLVQMQWASERQITEANMDAGKERKGLMQIG